VASCRLLPPRLGTSGPLYRDYKAVLRWTAMSKRGLDVLMQDILALASANLLSPAVLFFALGFLGTIAGSHLTLPEAVAKTLVDLPDARHRLQRRCGGQPNTVSVSISCWRWLPVHSAFCASFHWWPFGLLSVMAQARPGGPRGGSRPLRLDLDCHIRWRQARRCGMAGLSFEGYLVAVAAVMETPAILDRALFLAHCGRRSVKRFHQQGWRAAGREPDDRGDAQLIGRRA
jgi:hypothetical protein